MSDKPYPYNEDQLAWLHDLETTTEPQTKEWLHIATDGYGDRKQGFCCLGRACVIFGAEAEREGIIVTYDGEDTDLPPSLVRKLRLFSKEGKIKQDPTWVALSVMNDRGKSFKEIAAYIRANPWNVFRDPEDAA